MPDKIRINDVALPPLCLAAFFFYSGTASLSLVINEECVVSYLVHDTGTALFPRSWQLPRLNDVRAAALEGWRVTSVWSRLGASGSHSLHLEEHG